MYSPVYNKVTSCEPLTNVLLHISQIPKSFVTRKVYTEYRATIESMLCPPVWSIFHSFSEWNIDHTGGQKARGLSV